MLTVHSKHSNDDVIIVTRPRTASAASAASVGDAGPATAGTAAAEVALHGGIWHQEKWKWAPGAKWQSGSAQKHYLPHRHLELEAPPAFFSSRRRATSAVHVLLTTAHSPLS